MTWGRLDDGFYDNPKILSVSLAAVGLHASLVSYCNKHLTDGCVSTTATRVLSRGRRRLIGELVASGLLHENGDGYLVHDFLSYSPSRAQVLGRRLADLSRKQKESSRNPVGIPNGIQKDSAVSRPVPSRPSKKDPSPTPPQTTTMVERETIGTGEHAEAEHPEDPRLLEATLQLNLGRGPDNGPQLTVEEVARKLGRSAVQSMPSKPKLSAQELEQRRQRLKAQIDLPPAATRPLLELLSPDEEAARKALLAADPARLKDRG